MKPITTIIPTPPLVKRLALVMLGAVLFSLNLNTFVYSSSLFPGGFSGVALLIQRSAQKFAGIQLPYSLMYLLLNAFPVYISFRFIGKNFTLFSLVMILVSSALKDFLPQFMITDDAILCSVFGGILNGLSITLCLHADATSGGSDFIVGAAGRNELITCMGLSSVLFRLIFHCRNFLWLCRVTYLKVLLQGMVTELTADFRCLKSLSTVCELQAIDLALLVFQTFNGCATLAEVVEEHGMPCDA